MRKKSHISLAKFLLNNLKVQGLVDHRKAFYIGSILPDIKPSFITRRHTIEETFDILIDEIKKITIEYDINKGINGYYARHLGVVTHYLADYCTYPHNKIYSGSMKDHVYYEKDLKFSLREYVKRDEIQRDRETSNVHKTFDEIIHIIIKTHREYLNAFQEMKQDLHYIVELCFKVVDAIILFFEFTYEKLFLNKNENVQIECIGV